MSTPSDHPYQLFQTSCTICFRSSCSVCVPPLYAYMYRLHPHWLSCLRLIGLLITAPSAPNHCTTCARPAVPCAWGCTSCTRPAVPSAWGCTRPAVPAGRHRCSCSQIVCKFLSHSFRLLLRFFPFSSLGILVFHFFFLPLCPLLFVVHVSPATLAI